METNFDYLLEKKEYTSFAAGAIEAEKSIKADELKQLYDSLSSKDKKA